MKKKTVSRKPQLNFLTIIGRTYKFTQFTIAIEMKITPLAADWSHVSISQKASYGHLRVENAFAGQNWQRLNER